MSAHLHQTEMTLTVAGKSATVTLDVSYIYVPRDDGVGHQVELLRQAMPSNYNVHQDYDISHVLPTELQRAIIREIEGVEQ